MTPGVGTVENTRAVAGAGEGTDMETAVEARPALVAEADAVDADALARHVRAVVGAHGRLDLASRAREAGQARAVAIDANALIRAIRRTRQEATVDAHEARRADTLVSNTRSTILTGELAGLFAAVVACPATRTHAVIF